MAFDYEKLAERYKKSPAEVKGKVDAYAESVKNELKDFYSADKIDAEVEKIVVGNISNLFQLSGLEYAKDQYVNGNIKKANVIILGVSPADDRNSYEKWKAREAYKVDPNGALAAKKVRLQKREDGTSYAVALDSNPMITRKDKDGVVTEEPNPNYGKDIPDAMKVSIPMIIAGWVSVKDGKEVVESVEEFKMSSMGWDKDIVNKPDTGKKSTVYGRVNGQYFTVSKDAYEGSEVYEKAYDVAMRVLPTTDIWMDLSALNEQPVVEKVDGKNKTIYTKFATKATIQKCEIQDLKSQYNGRKYQKAKIRVGDVDVMNGINMGTSYEPVVAYVSEHVCENDEVIVLGCKKSFAKKDDQGKYVKDENGDNVMLPFYELWGVIKSFDSEHDKVIARLKEKGLL